MIRLGESLKVVRGCETYRFSVVFSVYEGETYATHCVVDATECSGEVAWSDMLEAMWKEYNAHNYYDEMEAYIDLDFIDTIIRLEWTYNIREGIIEMRRKEFK